MVDWLRPHFAEGNEIVDLFYAITDCQGWIRSTKTEVKVRLEPLQQPRRRQDQEMLCRKLTTLGARTKRLPAGGLQKRCPNGKEPGAATSCDAHGMTQERFGRGNPRRARPEISPLRGGRGRFFERRERNLDDSGIPDRKNETGSGTHFSVHYSLPGKRLLNLAGMDYHSGCFSGIGMVLLSGTNARKRDVSVPLRLRRGDNAS
jgi:hypothetical protein